MTDELITWLRAQLADDERIAREAGYRSLTWPTNETWWLEGVEHNVVGQEEAFCHPHNVEHIARHDPARVLAEVDAKRRMLGEHFEGHLGDTGLGSDRCDTCDNYAWPCPTLRLLALPYATRPGYRSEWAP